MKNIKLIFFVVVCLLFTINFTAEAAMSDADFLALCQNGTAKEVESAIKNGAGVKAKNKIGWSALMLALANNPNSEVVDVLIKSGANVNEADGDGITPMMLAASLKSDIRLINLLVHSKANINAQDSEGETALIKAILRNNPSVAVIGELIKVGADVRLKDKKGMRALNYAKRNKDFQTTATYKTLEEASRFDSKEFLELCGKGSLKQVEDAIKDSANVNTQDEKGNYAIMRAIWNSPEVMKALIAAGANVNAVDKDGMTVLMRAAWSSPDIVKLLLAAGADVNAKNKQFTALDYMRFNRRMRESDVYKMLYPTDGSMANDALFVEFCADASLLEIKNAVNNGANVNFITNSGVTPLMMAAAFNSDHNVTDFLIKEGADIYLKERSKRDAYFFAAVGNPNHKVVETLIKFGVDVNTADEEFKFTPLMYAVNADQNSNVIITLLNGGADVRAKNKWGKTALALAAQRNQDAAVLRALIKAGSDVNSVASYNHGYGNIYSTPLMDAVHNENPEIIKILLESGAKIDDRDEAGETALITAARYSKNSDVIVALVNGGANLKLRDRSNKTALDYIKENKDLAGTMAHKMLTYNQAGFYKICASGSLKDVEQAIASGASIYRVDDSPDNTLPVVWATANPDPQVMLALLKAGANVHSKYKGHIDLLMIIASKEVPDIESARMLIKAGLDVNARDSQGNTALIYAAKNSNHHELVKLLLDSGALPKLRNREGKNAEDYANANSEDTVG